jgi:hypothetical protein
LQAPQTFVVSAERALDARRVRAFRETAKRQKHALILLQWALPLVFIRKVNAAPQTVATSEHQLTLLEPQIVAPQFVTGSFRLAGIHFGLLRALADLIASTFEHNTDTR